MNRMVLALTAGLLLSAACKRRSSAAEVKDNLEKAMTAHLQARAEKSALHPKFSVIDVAWFEERQYYKCEFTVKMTLSDGTDTTGMMQERISKDFSTFNVPANPGH